MTSLYAFSNLARDPANCVLFTDKVCMTRRNRSIMHSRLFRAKKQLRRDVFMTILIKIINTNMNHSVATHCATK